MKNRQMTDKERIERLEKVLATLITWLPHELGALVARQLLAELCPDDGDSQ